CLWELWWNPQWKSWWKHWRKPRWRASDVTLFSNRHVRAACSSATEAVAWEDVIVNRDVVMSAETSEEVQRNRHAITVCSHVMSDADQATALAHRCAVVFVEVVPLGLLVLSILRLDLLVLSILRLDLLVLSILSEAAQISACSSAMC
ncbi:hypothetical protein OSTOST_01037, partial [Ostertagia ostertagi]